MSITITKAMVASLLGFVLLWSLGGCAGTPQKAAVEPPAKETQAPLPEPTPPPEAPVQVEPAPPPQPEYVIHTVKWSGETLGLIARWYTGAVSNWTVLAKANPEIDPHRIFIGTNVRIPAALIKTQDPLPREFVSSGGLRPAKKGPTTNP